jgi:hypothetical protein
MYGVHGESSQLRLVCCLLPKLAAPEHIGANYIYYPGCRCASAGATGVPAMNRLVKLSAQFCPSSVGTGPCTTAAATGGPKIYRGIE